MNGGEVNWTSCNICGRQFHSNKALYGHLRCHSPSERHVATRAPLQVHAANNGGGVSAAAQPPIVWRPVEVFQLDVPYNYSRMRWAVRCHKCGKTFDSYRSMGGHMAHHSMQERKRRRIELGEGSGGGGVAPPPPVPAVHHEVAAPPPSVHHEVVAPAETGAKRVVREFDLNELPPLEGEN